MLEFIQKEPGSYDILHNKKHLGYLIRLEDGDYYWFPTIFNYTCLSSYVLKSIYDKLEELNNK